MSLELRGYVELPPHVHEGGFDHAAVHQRSGHLFLAHTANDSVEVIDCRQGRPLRTLPGFRGVAGVLVSEERELVFTSNRGEDTVAIFPKGSPDEQVRVKVGVRPNGLAFDPARGLLLVANVGDPSIHDSFTVSLVDIKESALISSLAVPGRTRWAIYDPRTDAFYVNIRDPPQILVVDARNPAGVAGAWPIPEAGPHGLDLDTKGRRLFCACDAGKLLTVELPSGNIVDSRDLRGAPDVVFFNPSRRHLYVAIGDPGVVDVFDTETMERIESVPTERGAHTIALDATSNNVYVFLPESHRAAVLEDPGSS